MLKLALSPLILGLVTQVAPSQIQYVNYSDSACGVVTTSGYGDSGACVTLGGNSYSCKPSSLVLIISVTTGLIGIFVRVSKRLEYKRLERIIQGTDADTGDSA